MIEPGSRVAVRRELVNDSVLYAVLHGLGHSLCASVIEVRGHFCTVRFDGDPTIRGIHESDLLLLEGGKQ